MVWPWDFEVGVNVSNGLEGLVSRADRGTVLTWTATVSSATGGEVSTAKVVEVNSA